MISGTILGVEIHPAPRESEATIANLMQLYIHDFSERWSGTEDGELQDDGRFAPYAPLPRYWKDPDREAYLIRFEGRLAGFALLNAVSHSGLSTDRNVAEFFVVRKHRRRGVGLAAAQAIFRMHPCLWEVAVARSNTGALAFWRRTIEGLEAAEGIEELDVASAAWNGPIFRFRVRAMTEPD